MDAPEPTESEPRQYNEYDIFSQWESDKKWYKNEMKLVDLNKIPFQNWNSYRSTENLEIIKERKTVKPIELSYDEEADEYGIVDGNHRSWACQQLGYKYIPAIVPVCQTSKPFLEPKMKIFRLQKYVEEIVLKMQKKISFRTSKSFELSKDENAIEVRMNGRSLQDNVFFEVWNEDEYIIWNAPCFNIKEKSVDEFVEKFVCSWNFNIQDTD